MREYEYCVYNFQDTPRAAHAKGQMAQQEADGWTIHTASPGYSELCVLWVRDVASEDATSEPEHVIAAPVFDQEAQAFSVSCSCGWTARGTATDVIVAVARHPE